MSRRILLVKRGNAYLELNRFKEAYDDFTEEINRNGWVGDGYFGLASYHRKRGDLNAAIATIEKYKKCCSVMNTDVIFSEQFLCALHKEAKKPVKLSGFKYLTKCPE